MHTAKASVLNVLTFGGYGVYETGQAMWEGYGGDGVLGALNAVNPFYQVLPTSLMLSMAPFSVRLLDGDTRTAG